jgi:hypothetical protein
MPIYNTKYEPEIKEYETFHSENAAKIETSCGIALGEINVFCGEDIMSNTRAALRKSQELKNSGFFKRILFLNTGPNHRRVIGEIRKLAKKEKTLDSSSTESLICIGRWSNWMTILHDYAELELQIMNERYDAIVINSWEFASINARQKEALLFKLRKFSEQNAMTILIYSQARVPHYHPGVMMRGTLGKLAVIAAKIMPVPTKAEAVSLYEEQVLAIPSVQREVKEPLREFERVNEAVIFEPQWSEQFVGAAGLIKPALSEPIVPESGGRETVHSP